MTKAQRELADRIFNHLERDGLITYGHTQEAQRVIDQEVSR